jgi:hypothetical protein
MISLELNAICFASPAAIVRSCFLIGASWPLALILTKYFSPTLLCKTFSRLTSHVSRLTSHVSRLTSHFSRLTSHVSRLMSLVSRLSSLVSRLTSHVSRNSSLRLSSRSSRNSLVIYIIHPLAQQPRHNHRSSPDDQRMHR